MKGLLGTNTQATVASLSVTKKKGFVAFIHHVTVINPFLSNFLVSHKVRFID
jgi:hypothetical protein